jgi:hypothetical protein
MGRRIDGETIAFSVGSTGVQVVEKRLSEILRKRAFFPSFR